MIEKIVNDEINKVKQITNDMDSLCIYFSNNISLDLDENNIPNKIMDIRGFTNTNYLHKFVLAYYKNKYYLIDPTYKQFLRKNEKLLYFDDWPADKLKQKNQKLLDNLINKGYSIIDRQDLIDYLNSFSKRKGMTK